MNAKDAPIGSCWYYAVPDSSMYSEQYYVVTHAHCDALGDWDYEGYMTPLGREIDISDVVLGRYFCCISHLELNKVST